LTPLEKGASTWRMMMVQKGQQVLKSTPRALSQTVDSHVPSAAPDAACLFKKERKMFIQCARHEEFFGSEPLFAPLRFPYRERCLQLTPSRMHPLDKQVAWNAYLLE
jgi:hypothetical protein